MKSSAKETSYQATWVNTSTTADSPIISVSDYNYLDSAGSKVLYRANSSTLDTSLLKKSISVYINQGPSCDATAANYYAFDYALAALRAKKEKCKLKKLVSYKTEPLVIQFNSTKDEAQTISLE
jgi:hypothetical protein